ncbi:protein trichome birefringence-like 4 isoform X2 [Spinacia oleracea]|uniref:Protein trichome birefringence-like 4 isoform X2 n=1 Tax=Spinacia oleracea TaxID=3562 RepID=A0A9R0JHE7_SPIOL|nr:protein trichome birefringence-like 4 isoform X2 [Spinacia oleracea]
MLRLQNISISKHLPSKTTTLISTCFLLISSLLILINYPSTTNTLLSTLSFQFFSPFSNTTNSFANNSSSNVDYTPSNKKIHTTNCDIFDGRWVYDESYPVYGPSSCPYVDHQFSCFNNGRHDLGYLKYRWQPYGCDIPRFDAKKMMEMLRGKRLVFVGDSLSRNMCQSLICHLMEFEGQSYRDGSFYNYYFKDYNCSISLIIAPFLVQEHRLPNKKGTLRLDTMEATISKYRDADFLIFNTGHWWNPNKSENGKNFYQEGDVVHSNMTVGVAYTKALKTWAKWVDTNVNTTKTQVFYRGYANTHFRGGDWDTKGTCHNEIEPITYEKLLNPYSW